MKFPSNLVFLFLFASFFASCSRQLSTLSKQNNLQTVSSVVYQNPVVKQSLSGVNHQEIKTENAEIKMNPTDNKSQSIALTSIHNTSKAKLKFSTQTKNIIQTALAYPPAFNMLQKHVLDRDYPKINKGGFILIGAGILAFFLGLIKIACIALVVLGLIILLSPLFRRRY